MKKFVVSLLVVMGLACMAQGSLVVDPVYSSLSMEEGAFSVSGTDLINAGQATLDFVNTGVPMTYGSYANLNDGAIAFCAQDAGNADVQYVFNVSTNTLGYDIDQIDIVSSWGDVRVNQNFTVTFNYVDGRPSDSYSWNCLDVYSGGSLKVTLKDSGNAPIARGVHNIYFSFYPIYSTAGTALREIDVFGSATVVPEPATIGILCMGLLGLFRRKN